MKRTRYVTQAGIIAALYVVLTWVSSVLGLSSGAVQCRFSEALCILPIFTSAAIPGVTIGCLISNLVTTASIFDIILGSTATLIGALGAYLLRHGKARYFASLPTVISNAVIIPFVLKIMAASDALYIYNAATVAMGEIISCTALGGLLAGVIEKSGLVRYLKK